MDNTEEVIREVVSSWNRKSNVVGITAITPDASQRRYYRVELKNAPQKTAVVMIFDSIASPEHAGREQYGADESYVTLTKYFLKHGVLVPELYYDARSKKALIIEDLGSTQLADIFGKIKSEEKIASLYRLACNQIRAIQAIPKEDGNLAFSREFSQEQYVKEMLECSDYLLAPNTVNPEDIMQYLVSVQALAEKLILMPKTLVHRDFHSWNLLIDQSDQIRVIDFQDALLATQYYDLVALINDRDTDSLLGKDVYQEILSLSISDSPNLSYDNYLMVLLQRDLKVAGRFEKLASVRGLLGYRVWIPGTLKRIGRTLVSLVELTNDTELLKLLDILALRLEFVNIGKRLGVYEFVK